MEKQRVKEVSSVYYANWHIDMKKVICSDEFFHHLMEVSDNVRLLLCQSLIENRCIVDTTLENVEFFHSVDGGKKMILDIVAKDEEGFMYNVEMQVGAIDDNDFIRFQCYANKLLESQEIKGVDYTGIKEVYQLVISDKMINQLPYYQHDFHMYDNKYDISLPYHRIHTRIMQLSRIHQLIEEKRELKPIDEFMYLMSTGKEYRVEGSKEVMETMDEYIKYVQSDRFLADYSLFSRELLEKSKINSAKKKGKEEGTLNGKKDTLQKQLKRKYREKVDWIDECSFEQLDKIGELIFEDISLDELRQRVMNNDK